MGRKWVNWIYVRSLTSRRTLTQTNRFTEDVAATAGMLLHGSREDQQATPESPSPDTIEESDNFESHALSVACQTY